MEFMYGEYHVRYILNPTDFIIRFENKKTGKLYEETYFERDYAEYKSVGGLAFISKIIVEALEQTSQHATIAKFKVEEKNIHVVVEYTIPLIPTPVAIKLLLPQKRRDHESKEIEDMRATISKLREEFARELGKLKEENEKLRAHLPAIRKIVAYKTLYGTLGVDKEVIEHIYDGWELGDFGVDNNRVFQTMYKYE